MVNAQLRHFRNAVFTDEVMSYSEFQAIEANCKKDQLKTSIFQSQI